MNHETRLARDAFTFSLGGMSAIAAFVATPVIADDRINKALGENLTQPTKGRRSLVSLWMQAHGYIGQDAFA